MRKLFTLTLLCSHLFLAAIEEADLIISSNKVILMTEKESAQPLSVAIKNKKIIWIGSHEDAKNIQGEHVDFGNQAVLPGFIDAHGHASYLAFATQVANIASPPVGKINNIQDLQTELKNFIQDSGLQPGEWLMGLGYDDSLLAEQRHPTKDDLDEVSTEHPIYLIHVSAHLGAANSLGLSLANINSKTQDPPGGKIRRYENSLEPNGVFEETAAYPLQQLAMSAYKDPIGSVKKAMEIYARNGITTAQDGASSLETIGLMQAADAQNMIDIDVISYPIGQNGLIRLLWSSTNRITRSGKILGDQQKISTYDALKAMTLNAAYQHFEDDIKGSIEVGKLADLVVLSEDPLAMPAASLLNLKVIATYSHGKEIFKATK